MEKRRLCCCGNGVFSTFCMCIFRKVIWGMMLYTADSLADVERYDERHWGGNADEYALTLCLDAVLEI